MMPKYMKTSSRPSEKTFSSQTERLLSSLIQNSNNAQKQIDSILSKSQKPVFVGDAHRIIENLILRFHLVAKEISSRYDSRPTLLIENEYDVQDLLEGLLRIYFDDVRREQWTAEYAGCSTRIDFILQQEKIAIEVKKTRKGLGKKEVGNQLIIDIAHYKKHPNCKTLYCFVYDPEEIISNPIGLEKDLTGLHNDLFVKVMITPKRS
jgi:hypothetical protein